MTTLRVKVADFAVGRDGETVIVTVGLGSCVAIALYDPRTRVGGLAHVLLPSETMARDRTNRAKFPSAAVPLLLAEMRSLGCNGGVGARLVGGASMFASLLPTGGVNIGERNVAASRAALAAAGVPLLGEDVGGDYGRSVYFHLADGRVEVHSLKAGRRVI
ncbi:MAG TPA: chemotaxis protein CheD [Candidatus Saccharimonadia bacterium]|nr:chemotaxis protein CheD [Candidatus Saccharimonadia bacterium]